MLSCIRRVLIWFPFPKRCQDYIIARLNASFVGLECRISCEVLTSLYSTHARNNAVFNQSGFQVGFRLPIDVVDAFTER